jgi:acetolactate synthase-1/2/3 large subunit
MMSAFAQAGMPAIFGVPGGGSSLDLIAAAKRAGIPFILARTENGAGIMASALAELTQRPVGLLTTRGPGVSNAANAMANADLERAPVIMLADGFNAAEGRFTTHQWFDQAAMMAPVTRSQHRAAETPPGAAALAALTAALGAPQGPAYLEMAGDLAAAPADAAAPFQPPRLAAPDAVAVAAAQRLVAQKLRQEAHVGLGGADLATWGLIDLLTP